LKYEQYYPAFREAGCELTTRSFVSDSFWKIIYQKGYWFQKAMFTLLGYLKRFLLLFTLRRYDVVYVHLWVTPLGLPFFEMLTCLIAKKVVYDIDDMVFLGHSSAANRFFQSLKGTRKMIYLMKHADHVITCTPKLDQFVRQYNQHTTDISSTVDTTTRYLGKTDYASEEPLIIGWSGSHSTAKYLYLLQGVLQNLAKNHSFTLVVMGDKQFHIDGVNVEALDWEESIEMQTLQRFDIGLYPLPDEPWVYGKSGLKAIQYMALGVPTVAAALGANFRIIQDGVNGFLASPDDLMAWEEKISALLESTDLRNKFGTAARQTIVNEFSVDANKAKYLSILLSPH
jgi:glycosyltransferase involved in cell wall biosynthesis